MRQSKPNTYTIPQVLKLVDSLYNRSRRLKYLSAFRGKHINETFRTLISTCNSLAIVLLQFDVFETSLSLLKKALSADVERYLEKASSNRRWVQRPLIYVNLGYLFQRVGDYQSSLQFLNDAESLIQKMNQVDADTRDLKLSHALLSFSVMFKLHKYPLAKKYIEIASFEYNSVINNERDSRFTSLICVNFFCLITLALDVLKDDQEDLMSILEQLPPESAAAGLLQNYIENRGKQEDFYTILGQEFQDVLFVSCFFPFVDSSTPIIPYEELYNAQVAASRRRFSLKIGKGGELYKSIMEESLTEVK